MFIGNSTKQKAIKKLNNTCLLCLGQFDIDNYYNYNDFIVCSKCEKNNMFIKLNNTHINDIYNIYDNCIKKCIGKHGNFVYEYTNNVKKYKDKSYDLLINFDKNNFVLLFDFLYEYYDKEYLFQYIIIIYNIISIKSNDYIEILIEKDNLEYIEKIHNLLQEFNNDFKPHLFNKNKFIKNIIYNASDLIFRILANLRNKNDDAIVKLLFSCCIIIYSYLNTNEIIRFKKTFEYIFMNYGYSNIYNYDLIYSQIIRYGYLLSNSSSQIYFEKFEEDFWSDDKNWLYITNFKPYKL